MDGTFPSEGKQVGETLVVSYIGMKSKEVAVVDGKKELFIRLDADTEMLDEVLVTGYQTLSKERSTGAFSKVSTEKLELKRMDNLSSMLEGQVAGYVNGQIRGVTTMNAVANPMVVIDGFPVENTTLDRIGQTTENMPDLNPEDIESVTVLKDAASAAIYGSRAANGVILVTTKQGKTGKIQLSYDMYYGWQNVYKMPNTLNAQQFMAITDETNFNNGVPALNWQTQLGEYTWNMLQNGWQGTNWLDEMRNENAAMQNHAINLTGGNEMSKFSAGFSFTSQDGIIGKGTVPNYTRYTARINSDHVLLKGSDRDIIKIGENLLFYYSNQSTIAQTSTLYNDVYNSIKTTPLLPMHNAEGELFDYHDMQQTGWVYDDKQGNPILMMQKAHGLNKNRTYGLNATAYLEVEPIKNLKWRSSFSYR